jgi:2-polyprenyl-3-methyl-5-hydroxy-6-metoxy-1,4-benzoquinol methylase
MTTCPLCQASGNAVREAIQTAFIANLYQRRFGIDVGYLFRNIERVLFSECGACGLFYFSPPVTGDGAFYGKLQHEPWYYLESKYEYDFVANLIDRGASVLDIGSGKGAFAERLRSGVRYLGLDLNIESQARSRADIVNETIENHALAHRERYDFVVSFQSLEHVADPYAFLAAAAACMRRSGTLVIVVPSEDSFVGYASNSPLNMPPHHVTRWPDATLRHLARLLGLNLRFVHHEPLQEMHREWGFSVMAHAMLGHGSHWIESQASLFGRVRSRAAGALARLMQRCLSREFWPCGHSVIAVYAK